MDDHFVRISDIQAFDELAKLSKEQPIIIFKHSLTCPISAAAYNQMERVKERVALIEVQRARELSKEIEKRLGVPHESPQVIILRSGQVVWNASHFQITAATVSKAVKEANADTV
jgi:bacillithiol system protein YtxJ